MYLSYSSANLGPDTLPIQEICLCILIFLEDCANKIMLLSCYSSRENIYGAHSVKDIMVESRALFWGVHGIVLLCVCSANHISNSGHLQGALSLGKIFTAVSCLFPPRYKEFRSLPGVQSRTQSLILPGVTRASGASCGETVLPLPPARCWPTASSLHRRSGPYTFQASLSMTPRSFVKLKCHCSNYNT